jgi:type I restriction enzyme S subunit
MSFDIREHNLPLPKGWSYKKISDVAIVNANTIRKKDSPDEIYYIDISSVSNGSFEPPKHMLYADAPSRAKRIVKKNDFIISTVRPNLKQYVFLDEVHENWIASTGFAVVSAIEAGTEWYLYSVITSELFNEHLVRVADGGAYPAFNPKEIEDAVIFWPDKDSLRVINDLAFNLNTKQKNNTQTNQTLEQIAQALFKSWFVDFDPVKAKIETLAQGGSAADAELAAMGAISAKTLDELNSLKANNPEAFNKLAQTAALFPAAMQDSELGEIPEGWKVVTIKSLSDKISKGTTPSKNDLAHAQDEESIRFIKVKDINDQGEILRDSLEVIPESIHIGKLKRSILETNDILFSIAGTIGRVATVDNDLNNVNTNQAVAFIRLKDKRRFLPLVYTTLRERRLQDKALASIVQGVQANLSLNSLGDMEVIVPSNAVLDLWNKQYKSIFELIKSNFKEYRNISSLRDTLLPKLLSGEINVTSGVVE